MPQTRMAAEIRSTLLSVRDLRTYFQQDEGLVKAVDGVSFDLYSGGTLGIGAQCSAAPCHPEARNEPRL